MQANITNTDIPCKNYLVGNATIPDTIKIMALGLRRQSKNAASIYNLAFIFVINLSWNATCMGATSAERPSFERAIGFEMGFFSGDEAKLLVPTSNYSLGFSANYLMSRRINLINHFSFGLLSDGKNFANSLGAYSGYLGSYGLGIRLNLVGDSIQPYIETGGLLGLFAVTLSSSPSTSTTSQNQTALKHGYFVGTGVDWVKDGTRGNSGGLGIAVRYFHYSKSLSSFEFPAAKLGADGIQVEAHLLLAPSR